MGDAKIDSKGGTPNAQVDALIQNAQTWRAERVLLRAILLNSGLTEDLKWGKACYTYQGQNVAIFFGMKATCGIGFFKGYLLQDPDRVLVQQGETSQAVRLMAFTSVQEILQGEPVLRAFLDQAIALETVGRKVDSSQKHALVFPQELTAAFSDDPAFEAAFRALTPGRQRGYVVHFSGAKQSATRASRIEKCRSRILDGRGLNDWK